MFDNDPKLTGTYRGIVVDNDDPEQSMRLKVEVDILHDGIGTSDLPWAIPSGHGNLGGPEDQESYGQVDVPYIGGKVLLKFEQGDPLQPIWFHDVVNKGAIPKRFKGLEDDAFNTIKGNLVGEEKESVVGQYPNSRGFVLENGTVVEYDEENDRYLIFLPNGFRFEVLEDGSLVRHIPGDGQEIIIGKGYLNIAGDWDIEVGGDINMTASGDVNIQGTNINLN